MASEKIKAFKRNDIVVEKYGGDRFLWFLREGGITGEPDFIARIGNGVWGKSFSIVDIGIGGSVGKKKKKFNWAKYEGRDDEIRKLAELLKAIWNWANLIR